MIIAWTILVPLAITFPVLFKSRSDSPVNWFLYHRVLVGIALALVLVATFIAMANTPSFHFGSGHGKLGIGTVGVSLLQAAAGVLRPHKDELHPTRARSIWEFVHRCVIVLV
jgi:hypothetical protein